MPPKFRREQPQVYFLGPLYKVKSQVVDNRFTKERQRDKMKVQEYIYIYVLYIYI